MNPLSLVPTAAVLAWIIHRQFVGRYVSMQRTLVLPLVLVVLGLLVTGTAGVVWTAATIVWIAADLLITSVLGVVRGRAITLSLRDGYLYQRGGVPCLLLWLVSIAARIAVAVLASGTPAGPAVEATLLLTFGISLGVQGLVLVARVRTDGRPLHPGGDRRATRAPSTLVR